MKLLVQPGDGFAPLLAGIEGAKKSVQIVIFRFDSKEIERGLRDAVKRGVTVQALVACTNGRGEESLRDLEMRLLEYGITVVRTGDDLARYHDKIMIIDQEELYLLAFNLTALDTVRSRSFGIVTKEPKLVEEAVKLYEADSKRQTDAVKNGSLVISPLNARKKLQDFIRKAKKQLLIYDPKISDPAMVRLLEERAQAGAEVKIIGELTNNRRPLEVRNLVNLRLHTRTMIGDGRSAFIGSQSLRKTELDARREVGIIFRERRVINRLIKVFQEDWMTARSEELAESHSSEMVESTAKVVSKTVVEDLPPVAPVVENALKEIAGVKVNGSLDRKEIEATVKGTVKQAVADAVEDVVKDLVEEAHAGGQK